MTVLCPETVYLEVAIKVCQSVAHNSQEEHVNLEPETKCWLLHLPAKTLLKCLTWLTIKSKNLANITY